MGSVDHTVLAQRALLAWYQESGLLSKDISFDDALAYYADNAPAQFIPVFGDIIAGANMSEDQVAGLMRAVGDQGGPQYPNWQNFTQAIITEQSSWTFQFSKAVPAALIQTAQQVGTAVAWGGGVVLVVAAAALLLFAYEKGEH